MGTRSIILVAVLDRRPYAISSAARGDLLPSLVGGALAAVLCFLVLRRVEARWRWRDRPPQSTDSHR